MNLSSHLVNNRFFERNYNAIHASLSGQGKLETKTRTKKNIVIVVSWATHRQNLNITQHFDYLRPVETSTLEWPGSSRGNIND